MKRVTFEEADRADLILGDAHIHCSRVEQYCVSELYWKQPRTHSGLIFVVEGAHVFTDQDGTRVEVGANELLYVPEGCRYYHSPCIGQNDKNGVPITKTLLYVADFQLLLGREHVVFSERMMPVEMDSMRQLAGKFEKMVTLYNSAMPSGFRFQSQMYDILSDVCEEYSRKRLPSKKQALIRPAVNYLQSCDVVDADVSGLAARCFISENYFRKLFLDCYGCLPQQYLNGLKMKRAVHLLELGNLSIRQISELLGYSSPSYFSACFKRYYGCLPSQYNR